jgi:hypothetical protein
VIAASERPASRRARRWPILAGAVAAALVAAVAVVIVTRGGGRTADGTLVATERTTADLGDRAVVVAEEAAALTWHVARGGDAEVDQTAGDVFYRVERGGAFVVHTPAGDVRVTGTCLRIEVIAMNKQMIVSGAVGAAIAAGVVVTVYEGHVVAESRGARTELAAGTRATLGGDGTAVVGDTTAARAGVKPDATRDELAARAVAQQDQILHLKSRVAELEKQIGKRPSEDVEEGRLWHDPSHDKLVEWAEKCHVRLDEPGLDRWQPLKQAGGDRGIEPSELDGYNGAITDIAKQWSALVKQLYVETTGDAAGAETLSIQAMQNEILEKSGREEYAVVLQKLARERAGLQAPPADPSKTSPLERFMRAWLQLGDQSEQALAKRIGAQRAHEIRGDGWGSRHDTSGCPGGGP